MNAKVQGIVDNVEQALADLRADAADAKQRGLEALVQVGQRAQAALDEGDDEGDEPTAGTLPAEPEA